MADALTGLALYSALAAQVYRQSNVKGAADQPLTVDGDGNKLGAASTTTGQTMVDLRLSPVFATNPLTAGHFQIDNNYVIDTATGFVGMVTVGEDGHYTVTFRGTDAGDVSKAELFSATAVNTQLPSKLDPLDWQTNVSLANGEGLNNSQAQDAINLTRFVIQNLAGGGARNVTVTGQSLGGGLAGIVLDHNKTTEDLRHETGPGFQNVMDRVIAPLDACCINR